jgi:hypothetical protein
MGAAEADCQPQVWRTSVEPVPDLPVPGPERDGRARWVTRWKPALTAFAITPSKAASRPMNTTRPNQINRLPIDPASSGFHEGCESRWLSILGPRRLSA